MVGWFGFFVCLFCFVCVFCGQFNFSSQRNKSSEDTQLLALLSTTNMAKYCIYPLPAPELHYFMVSERSYIFLVKLL